MFKCEYCHKSSDPGSDKIAPERPVRVVVETRPKTYDTGGEKPSEGFEIVKEMTVHSPCADKIRREQFQERFG